MIRSTRPFRQSTSLPLLVPLLVPLGAAPTRPRRKPWLKVGVLLVTLLAACCGCREQAGYPRRPITLVCPWAAGGGTDRCSRQMAVHLEKALGVPVNVINATGGKGVTGHRRGLKARADGYTLTMATVELNMMHWTGLTRINPDDCIPLMSINEDYAALFVRGDAPWRTLPDLERAIAESPGTLKASGTASGGIWHLALAGWLQAKDLDAEDVVWISSEGAGPSLQELLSGGLDMVCCSLPEARSLYESGEIRALGVMAPRRAAGFEDVPTFAEQGTPWSLGGWRGLAVPLGTPPERVGILVDAIEQVVTGQTTIDLVTDKGKSRKQTFPEFMRQQGFDNTWRPPPEFAAFLDEQDRKFGELLSSEAMQSVGRDPFPAWAFPAALTTLAGLLLLGLLVNHMVLRRPEPNGRLTGESGEESAEELSEEANKQAGEAAVGPVPRRGVVNFLAVLLAMLVYLVAAETVGFVPTVTVLLFGLLWLFGNSAGISLLIAAIFTPAIYQLFAHLLRVPLPRGWLGW